MATCTAIIPGKKGECLKPVPEDAPIRLCYLHGLLAHQWVQSIGGAQVVASEIRREATH